MKLRSLSLQRFRQHRETSISFPDGVIGIIGPNGSGKSTIIEAIGFALYGSKAIRGTLDTVRTADEVKGSVVAELSFEQEGVQYRVERTTADAKLFVGGTSTPTVKGGREVSERVRNILGMTYDEFISTFYTEQKGLEFLSQKKGGTERERFILRMIGYDRLEKVHEKLRDDRKALKNQILGLEQAQFNKDELSEELSSEQKVSRQLEEELDTSQSAITAQSKIAEDYKKAFEIIAADRQTFERVSKELQSTEAVYQERIKRIAVIEEEKKKILIELKESEKKLSGVAENLQEKLDNIIKEIKSIENKKQTEEKNHIKIQSSLEADFLTRRKISKDIEEKIERIKNLGSHTERCPTCGQGLGSGVEEAINHLKAELKVSEEAAFEAKKAYEASKIQPQALIELLKEESKLISQKEELIPAVQELNSQNELKNKIQKIDETLNELRSAITSSDTSLRELRNSLSKLTFNEAKYNSEKVRYEAQNALITNLRMERLKREGDLKERRGRIEKIQSILNKLKAQQELLSTGKDSLLRFEEADTLLTDFRKHIADSLRPKLSEAASELLYELTEGRYSSVEFSEDFIPHISEDGELKKVISGGEEDILHLSVRLGLSQLLAERSGKDFSLLILDEVFGSLDESRRMNLLQLLARLTNRFEQIIIISHFDDVKDSVDNVIGLTIDESSGSSKVVVATASTLDLYDEKTINL